MSYKYKCYNAIAKAGLEGFSDEYERVENDNEADAILVRSADLHGMEIPANLKCVARAGAGVNNIPVEECAKKGVVVFNTPGANANAVKELAIAAMLLGSRDIIGGIEWIKENSDQKDISAKTEKEKKRFAGNEIAGKKLGIIGLGAIGVRVANAATDLGMEVYGYDPFLSINAAWSLERDVKHIKDINEIYRSCDFITVHVPAIKSTEGMINKEAIAIMKDGVVIINLSRDILVNEADIISGINDGIIGKYITDFPTEGIMGQKSCIVIPHLGASTEESEENCAVMAVQEVRDFLENGNITNSVNMPGCDLGACNCPRIGIIHKNNPGKISNFTALISELGYNISDLSNKSKGEYAYTLMDIENDIDISLVEKLRNIEGVINIRVIRDKVEKF